MAGKGNGKGIAGEGGQFDHKIVIRLNKDLVTRLKRHEIKIAGKVRQFLLQLADDLDSDEKSRKKMKKHYVIT